MHREKYFYFKMLLNFEPNVAQWSVASRNDHKSKACLPEASNTAFAESCVCRRTNQIFYQPVFQLAWFAILCSMTDLLKSDFRVSLGFWKTKPYLASPSPCSFVVDTFCHNDHYKENHSVKNWLNFGKSCHKVSICLRGAGGLGRFLAEFRLNSNIFRLPFWLQRKSKQKRVFWRHTVLLAIKNGSRLLAVNLFYLGQSLLDGWIYSERENFHFPNWSICIRNQLKLGSVIVLKTKEIKCFRISPAMLIYRIIAATLSNVTACKLA